MILKKKKKKRKKEDRAIRALKTQQMSLSNTLAHGHLWRGSTQIEYSKSKDGTTSMNIVN